MKLLGIDIGAGTKDIFYYDTDKRLENCVKMVLPSPTLIYSDRIEQLESDLYVHGHTIGGGELVVKCKELIGKGYRIFMSEEAAFSLYNHLDRVKNLGIKIVDKQPENFKGENIKFDEVNIVHIRDFLSHSLISLDDLDGVAIAVQDHGVPPKEISQNKFRLLTFKDHFSRKPEIRNFLFSENEIPSHYLRMKSAVKSVKNILPDIKVSVMDSTIAALTGCLYDRPETGEGENTTLVNIGNSHITAGLVENERIIGFMEHHTSLMTPEKLERYLKKLGRGVLTDREVTLDRGHGVFYLRQPPFEQEMIYLVTGPNRMMVEKTNLRYHFSAPSGDVMMTGAFGLVKIAERRLSSINV